jgi:hypothetical protein
VNEIMSLNSDKRTQVRFQGQTIPSAGRHTAIAGTFVRCAKCSRDFRSTLTFKTLHEFERAARVGFIAQCPNCFTIFDCNRGNMYCELAPGEAPDVMGEVVAMPVRGQPDSGQPESG